MNDAFTRQVLDFTLRVLQERRKNFFPCGGGIQLTAFQRGHHSFQSDQTRTARAARDKSKASGKFIGFALGRQSANGPADDFFP